MSSLGQTRFHMRITSANTQLQNHRGSKLRKTDWVIGAVVFTGPDTKVVRNMLPAPRKVRSSQRRIEKFTVAWDLI